jgi:hypothetical protein
VVVGAQHVGTQTGVDRGDVLAGLPAAIFPAFAKAAWLAILSEFNPFKYNSFPANGATAPFDHTFIPNYSHHERHGEQQRSRGTLDRRRRHARATTPSKYLLL